jgi:hypothetical protein
MWKRCLSLFVLEINDPVGGNSFGPVRCLQIGTTRESQLSYGDNSISIPFAIKTRFLLVEIRKVSTYYESVLLHLHFGLDGRPSLSLPNNTCQKRHLFIEQATTAHIKSIARYSTTGDLERASKTRSTGGLFNLQF